MARKALLICLALILALAVPALAQKKSTGKAPSSSSVANAHPDFVNFGQTWTAMTDHERDYFLEGIATADRIMCMNVVYAGADSSQNPQDSQKRFMECFLSQFPYKPGALKAAMTSLYQDKANNIVPYDLMFGMALLKVKGDPYEDNLAKLRQELSKRGK